MIHEFRSPMLAERRSMHEFKDQVLFPLYASAKLDGIRCTIVNGVATSRSLKPIPNAYIQSELGRELFNGLDGELIMGDPCAEDCYLRTNSAVMSKKGEPEFSYYVFDHIEMSGFGYHERMKLLLEELNKMRVSDVPAIMPILHPYRFIRAWDELEAYETQLLLDGYEGVIARSFRGLYKQGRSTRKEQGMMKLKRFHDSEAEIIGVEELMVNENEAFTNELGRTARSKAQDGLVPGDTLGALHLRDLYTQVEFRCGMFKGFSANYKKQLWDNRDKIMGKIFKYSHFPIGAKDKPRHPKGLGFRDKIDL